MALFTAVIANLTTLGPADIHQLALSTKNDTSLVLPFSRASSRSDDIMWRELGGRSRTSSVSSGRTIGGGWGNSPSIVALLRLACVSQRSHEGIEILSLVHTETVFCGINYGGVYIIFENINEVACLWGVQRNGSRIPRITQDLLEKDEVLIRKRSSLLELVKASLRIGLLTDRGISLLQCGNKVRPATTRGIMWGFGKLDFTICPGSCRGCTLIHVQTCPENLLFIRGPLNAGPVHFDMAEPISELRLVPAKGGGAWLA